MVVCVVGDFNDWDTRRHPMRLRSGGIWEIFIPGIGEGAPYKYYVRSRFARLPADEGRSVWLRDRRCRRIRLRVVADLDSYEWKDAGVAGRARPDKDLLKQPDVDLRSAPGIVAAQAERREPELSRAGASRSWNT